METKNFQQLHFRIKNLPDLDKFSKTDSRVLVYARETSVAAWKFVGSTETIVDDLNPRFAKTVSIKFSFERSQELKFMVLDMDDDSSVEELDFKKNKLVGFAQTTLGNIVAAPRGRLVLRLTDDKGRHVRKNETDVTEFRVSIETIQHDEKAAATRVQFFLSATGLADLDFFTKSDPFVQVWRFNEADQIWTKVDQTKVVYNNLNPVWKEPIVTTMQDLCCGNDKTRIKFIVLDDDGAKKAPEVIGECFTTVADLVSARGNSTTMSLTRSSDKSKTLGQLTIQSFKVIRPAPASTLENFLVGGLNVQVAYSIDFTRSNLMNSEDVKQSLHYLGPAGSLEYRNLYQTAIYSTAQVLEPFNRNKIWDVNGFGAQIHDLNTGKTTLSHYFNIWGAGNKKYCSSIQEIDESYKSVFGGKDFAFWGPTNLAPSIDYAYQRCIAMTNDEKTQTYCVLVILTDGEISDLEATKTSIVRASTCPLSIVIVGVGNAKFDNMKILDGDESKKLGSRDIVQFVAMRDFIGRPNDLAAAILAEIPTQIVEFYKSKNLSPIAV